MDDVAKTNIATILARRRRQHGEFVRMVRKKTRSHSLAAAGGPVLISVPSEGELMARVVRILDQARANAVHAVNSNMVIAYWLIGREIVTALQGGEQRADYGSQMIETLSASLTQRYGRGFSTTNLKYFRLFFQTYAGRDPEIRHDVRDESDAAKLARADARVHDDLGVALAGHDGLQGFSPRLSWTHYRTLCRIEQQAERLFYEIEAERNCWSQLELERQMHSHLYLRLVKSRDKTGVMELAIQGQRIERPVDAIKHPYVLDFLDLPEAPRLHESDLEAALMDKLQPFFA